MSQFVPTPKVASDTAADYQRVALDRLERRPSQAGAPLPGPAATHVRWMIIPLSAALCVSQAVATILACHLRGIDLTCTLIPVLAFILLFAVVLAVNPVLRLAEAMAGKWAGPLNRAELVCLFTAMLVTAGISSYGLANPLIPLVAAPNDPELNKPSRGWNEALVPSLNPKLYLQDPEAIRLYAHGVMQFDPKGLYLAPPRDTASWGEKLDYGWKVAKVIPWKLWIAPLAYWLVFIVGCYGIFYSLTYIVLSHWSQREKLIFPLARFFESILPEPGGGRYRIPRMLLDIGFWCGFAVSFFVLSWNAVVSDAWLRGLGLPAIPLGMPLGSVSVALNGSIFQGLAADGNSSICFLVVFTAIGIAFLLPLEVSFSVWFYYLMGQVIMLLHIWSGRGASMAAFPADDVWLSNPTTSMGGGAIFVFSGICLFHCIRDYGRMVAGKSFARRVGIVLPVVGLVACMAVVVAWLMWNHLPMGWAVVFVGCFTLLTIGLMRIVAESGIYWFQSFTSFFHLYKLLGLGKVLAPVLMAPLLPIYSVLFLDMRTFIAPNILNAAEMRRSSLVNRWKFHLNLVVCMAVSVVVALATTIYLAHFRGGANMNYSFFNYFTGMVMDGAERAITTLPAFDLTHTLWYAGGAVWVILSVVLRTWVFWFPHPIGFIMLMNPMMFSLWFSFFLGWICKKAAVSYGGKATYDRVRGIFIGLVTGELFAVFFWMIIGLQQGIGVGSVALNRWFG